MTRYDMYLRYTVEELTAMLMRLRETENTGKGIALYSKSAARKMDDIAWVIAWKMRRAS